MSATRFHDPPHKPAGPAAADAVWGLSRGRLRFVRLTAFLAVAWTMMLLVMALQTANPRVVSRDQILHSDLVVIARRIRPADDSVRVERVFRGEIAEGDELHVRHLAVADDEPYVVPLTNSRGAYVITTLAGQRTAPLVYRVSPDTIEAVKSILREHL